MLRTLAMLALISVSSVAVAQSAPSSNTRTLKQAQATAPDADSPEEDETLAASGKPPEKVRSVLVTGDQKCPKSSSQEIVVCSHGDADDRFRIPPRMREPAHPAANNSWVNRAAVIDEVSREAGGLPNTCSVNGSGGQTGCSWQALQRWQAEKQAKQRADDASR